MGSWKSLNKAALGQQSEQNISPSKDQKVKSYGLNPFIRRYRQALREALTAVKDPKTDLTTFTIQEIENAVTLAKKELKGNGDHDGPGDSGLKYLSQAVPTER